MEHDSFLAAHNKEYLAHAQAQAQAQAQTQPSSRTGLQQQQQQQQQQPQQQQQQQQQQQPYHPSTDPYFNNPADPTANYGMVNPYHHHQSPTLSATHSGPGSDIGYTSPQLQYQAAYQPYQTSPHMDAMVFRTSQQGHPSSGQDPYRSAYAQQQHHQQQHLGSFSPYNGSMAVPLEDINQGSHHSRLSLASSSVSGASQRYPMHVLQGQGSSQALSTSFQQNRHQQGSTGQVSSSSEYGGRSDQDKEDNRTKQQSSKDDSTIQRAKSEEDDQDENTEILARNSQSGDRSAISLSSQKRASKSSRKNMGMQADESDEEEGQERGENRYKDKKRCFCCSRRICVYMTFLTILCLGVALFFLIPRAPVFSFQSVSSGGAPVVTAKGFQEAFSLQLRVDSSENYLPLTINSIEMKVWYKLDMTLIGHNEGLASSFVIKPKQIQVISVPMTFDYTSLMIDTNADGTYQRLLQACKPVDVSSGAIPESDLNLTFGGVIHFWGLSWIWKPQFGLNVGNVPCPVNARDPSTMPPPPPPPPPVVQPPTPPPATTTTPGGASATTQSGASGTASTTYANTGSSTPSASAPAPSGSRAA
ncbi:hypothetical protein BGX29_007924 [Mortierella sp. GBA35]|nr:hypothetical protein BGX29_007924 [Mortierella sp. GBA35]